jgi:hypothetical protein
MIEIVEISQDIKHAADAADKHAESGGGAAQTARYPTKIKRIMIFVLRHQVKVKVAGKCGKSVAKSTENNRNPVL